MYQRTENPDVIKDLDSGSFIPRGNSLWPEDESVIAPLPSPTFAEIVQALKPGLQGWMDSVARSNGYDSVISCASYANSGVAQWKADALAIIAWRDAVWQAAYVWQEGANGQLPVQIPTLADVIAQLPQPEAFGWVAHDPGYSLTVSSQIQ